MPQSIRSLPLSTNHMENESAVVSHVHVKKLRFGLVPVTVFAVISFPCVGKHDDVFSVQVEISNLEDAGWNAREGGQDDRLACILQSRMNTCKVATVRVTMKIS